MVTPPTRIDMYIYIYICTDRLIQLCGSIPVFKNDEVTGLRLMGEAICFPAGPKAVTMGYMGVFENVVSSQMTVLSHLDFEILYLQTDSSIYGYMLPTDFCSSPTNSALPSAKER